MWYKLRVSLLCLEEVVSLNSRFESLIFSVFISFGLLFWTACSDKKNSGNSNGSVELAPVLLAAGGGQNFGVNKKDFKTVVVELNSKEKCDGKGFKKREKKHCKRLLKHLKIAAEFMCSDVADQYFACDGQYNVSDIDNCFENFDFEMSIERIPGSLELFKDGEIKTGSLIREILYVMKEKKGEGLPDFKATTEVPYTLSFSSNGKARSFRDASYFEVSKPKKLGDIPQKDVDSLFQEILTDTTCRGSVRDDD